jgi:hypothetical protein
MSDANGQNAAKGHWTRWHTAALILITATGAVCGVWIPLNENQFMWVALLVLLVLFAVVAGWGITGLPVFGWLLNEQNRLSLSRLQMFLWTFVVLSAFLAAAFINLKTAGVIDPLAIKVPEQLWLAMGIGTTSLVGTPLILNLKKQKKTNDRAKAECIAKIQPGQRGVTDSEDLNQKTLEAHFEGSLARNDDPKKAGLGDLIRGEETSNSGVVDLTRLQNLFFTLILVGAYAGSLWSLFGKGGSISDFPALAPSSLALLGISHAGFLAGKAVDKQPEGREVMEALMK